MKTVGILVVVAIALYAVYELFSSNASLKTLFGSPGTITGAGTSVPGVPVYSNVAQPANNTALAVGAGTALAASVAPTSVSDAFGSLDLSSDEDDVSDVVSSSTDSSTLADFASGSGSSY